MTVTDNGILEIRRGNLNKDRPQRKGKKGRWDEVYRQLASLPMATQEKDGEAPCLVVTVGDTGDARRLRLGVYNYAKKHNALTWEVHTASYPREDGEGVEVWIWKTEV